MDAQLLARTLISAGFARAGDDENKTYLLEIQDGELIEKPWVGGYATGETPITSDVRENTSATYLFPFGDDTRLVFFISEDNLIECYVFDEETSADWHDTKLGETSKIVTGPNSKLSSNLAPEGGKILAYEDADGQLVVVTRFPTDEEWKKLDLPATEPLSGTPLSLTYIQENLHLFYVGQDSNIHDLARDASGERWSDSIVPNTACDEPIRNFTVTADPGSDKIQVAILAGDYVWLVNEEKGKTRLGEVLEDGRLELDDKEQNGRFWCWSCSPPHWVVNRVPFAVFWW